MRAIDALELKRSISVSAVTEDGKHIFDIIDEQPTIEPEPKIVRCKSCKHWRQQTTYQGAPLSFGFCGSDRMWISLYGDTTGVSHIDTDDDFYCGYAERRTKALE